MRKRKLLVTIVSIITAGILLFYLLYNFGIFKDLKNDQYPAMINVLPIPPLLEDKNPSPEKAEFELTAMQSSSEFISGKETKTFGYNGNYLGPVIKVRTGEEVSVFIKNELGEATTLHWHGLKVDGEMDGGPMNDIGSGETWNPHFTINQPAATLWYHPHQMDKTAEQVYMGLAGLFFIEDEISDQLDIPKNYGVDDVPLVIQDKTFDAEGKFNYDLGIMDTIRGLQGDTILVNGAINPYLEVPQGMVRLRLLNGSNASTYSLTFSNEQTFYQIASDGGFLEKPVAMTELKLGPGERAEILVDFSVLKMGERVQLLNKDTAFMDFIVKQESQTDFQIPNQLTTIEKIDKKDAVKKREFIFEGNGKNVSINGKQMDMDRVDGKINAGDAEIWYINNYTGLSHPFHAHGTQFQILEREGNPPPANESGWKDTFLVGPGEDVTVIAKFEHTGKFMFHCHILEHEDAGMMGQFEVGEF